MIDMTDVATDPDFCQDLTVTRENGVFAKGGFRVTSTEQVPVYGSLQPTTDEDLQQMEEGDRVKGMMTFISTDQLYKTRTAGGNQEAGLSDTFVWPLTGQQYKVVKTAPWGDYGFWKAFCVRTSGV